MKLEILGCSGGIGKGLKTTTFLLDNKFLIDAGSGLELLTLDQMLAIRTIVITHAHLDHIIGLPLMLATIYDAHKDPIQVHASKEVVTALRQHIFNWTVWPDYTKLPEDRPILELHELKTGDTISLAGYDLEILPAVHPTPTVGYYVSNGERSFAFTGDNGCNDKLWPVLNRLKPNLLIIDVSFTDDTQELAKLSGHLTPSQLQSELDQFEVPSCTVKITHLKPGFEKRIMRECLALMPERDLTALQHGEVLQI